MVSLLTGKICVYIQYLAMGIKLQELLGISVKAYLASQRPTTMALVTAMKKTQLRVRVSRWGFIEASLAGKDGRW
jgi:hypothetical protein